jgi:hypothetical protein
MQDRLRRQDGRLLQKFFQGWIEIQRKGTKTQRDEYWC